jgi:hypothetical protein
MGAFEYQPPPKPQVDQPAADPPGGGAPDPDPGASGPGGGQTDPGPTGPDPGKGVPAKDTKPPVMSKLSFKRVTAKAGGTFQLTLSEAATVELTFKPKKGKTKRLRFKARAGRNKLKLEARKLGARAFKVTAVATDAGGNRSTTLRARLTVRP